MNKQAYDRGATSARSDRTNQRWTINDAHRPADSRNPYEADSDDFFDFEDGYESVAKV